MSDHTSTQTETNKEQMVDSAKSASDSAKCVGFKQVLHQLQNTCGIAAATAARVATSITSAIHAKVHLTDGRV